MYESLAYALQLSTSKIYGDVRTEKICRYFGLESPDTSDFGHTTAENAVKLGPPFKAGFHVALFERRFLTSSLAPPTLYNRYEAPWIQSKQLSSDHTSPTHLNDLQEGVKVSTASLFIRRLTRSRASNGSCKGHR